MTEIEVGNVTRYCKPSTLENGVPQLSAFARRKRENYLSVYWLDYFKKKTEIENIREAKKYMEANGFSCKQNGSFVVLNIRQSKVYILEEAGVEIFYRDERLPHCGIFHDANDLLIAELLSECIQSQYLVRDLSS